MVVRALARLPWLATAIAVIAVAARAVAAPAATGGSTGGSTEITIWNATAGASNAYGGDGYGGVVFAPTTGALVTLHRELDLPANGDVRIADIPLTIDAASAQLRSLRDPGGITIDQQRVTPGALTPDDILAHHVGDAITVVTTKGEVSGVLRALDPTTLALEVGTADQRHLQLVQRGAYVLDIKLPPGPGSDRPSLVWHVATRKPGKQDVEISYRADGMSWTADYAATLDDTAHTLDLTAWATVQNATGASFDNATLTLINNNVDVPTSRPPPAPARFAVPVAVRLGAGESTQVALLAARAAAKPRTIVTYEAQLDQSASFQEFPAMDCNQFNGKVGASGHAEVALEVDLPEAATLPAGRVRLFRRTRDRVELVSEDTLRTATGVARIRLADDAEVVGSRRATACTVDIRAQTLRETIEVELENKGAQAAEIVVREYLFRWPLARIEAESVKGASAGPQTREYRLHVAAHGKQTITYSVLYPW